MFWCNKCGDMKWSEVGWSGNQSERDVIYPLGTEIIVIVIEKTNETREHSSGQEAGERLSMIQYAFG